MIDDRFLHVTDITDVHHGHHALTAILSAFLRARGRLVVINDTKAVFTPAELRIAGEAIVECIPRARAFGARQSDADELRSFADILLRNAEDAAAVSPHGLH